VTRVRGLDDRWVPTAARRLRDLVSRVDRWLQLVPRPTWTDEDEVDEPTPAPSLWQRARDWDDRYARKGLLGFVAEVPQMGVVLVTLLLAVNAFTVAARQTTPEEQKAKTGSSGVNAGADPTQYFVGIQPGAPVATYIQDAKKRLEELAATPDGSVLGLMVFDRYVTPARAAQLVSLARPTQAYYAAQGKGVPPGETAYAPVVDVAVDLPKQLRATASQLMVRVKQNEQLAPTIPGINAEERAQKAELLRDAAGWRAQAAALSGSCACVFAVVIRAKAREMVELARQPGVRLIDPAPPGSQTALLEFRPLRPEVTAVEPTVGPGAP
jgi:hypothetical protein